MRKWATPHGWGKNTPAATRTRHVRPVREGRPGRSSTSQTVAGINYLVRKPHPQCLPNLLGRAAVRR